MTLEGQYIQNSPEERHSRLYITDCYTAQKTL